jgi:Fe-S-cluster-containing dehydrogenase component
VVRYGIVFDQSNCVRSRTCYVACKVKNGIPPSKKGYRRLSYLEYEEGEYPSVLRHFIPLICMQCDDPICVQVCPTCALYKNDMGIILVDDEKCDGCGLCVVACPYGACYLDEDRGVVDKCDFCFEQGLRPACVDACQSKSIIFGDLDDPESEVSKLVSSGVAKPLLPDLGTKPKVFYVWPKGRVPSVGGKLMNSWLERWKLVNRKIKVSE